MYESFLARLLSLRLLQTNNRILICGAEIRDVQAMQNSGMVDFELSNIVQHSEAISSHFVCHVENLENLSHADESFDFVIAHQVLHHCLHPHRALAEMYRVSRKGVIFFEPKDSLLTWLGVRLGIGQEFETASVHAHRLEGGGSADSSIPNYVFRFSEREVRKFFSAANPIGPHRIIFESFVRLPTNQLKSRLPQAVHPAIDLFGVLILGLARYFGAFANSFAVLVLKPSVSGPLFPWLTRTPSGEVVPFKEWFDARYKS